MGYTMRTERYRYTEWGIGGALGVELYDHRKDPKENVNIAHRPENAGLVAKLSRALAGGAGWRTDLPLDLVSPARPTGLRAIAGNAQVSLSWTWTPGALRYAVYRATSRTGRFVAVATNLTQPGFRDRSVTHRQTYYYTVRASNNTGTSPRADPVSATRNSGSAEGRPRAFPAQEPRSSEGAAGRKRIADVRNL
jgi:hypothetical protein